MKTNRIIPLVALCALLLTPLSQASAKPAHSPRWTAEPARTAEPVMLTDGVSSESLAAEIVRQVNQERARAGLSELRVSEGLERAAQVRAREIARQFSHTRPDGSSWRTVSALAYGENIAMGQRTADKAMAAWMSSSGHRANILRASFGSIGTAALRVNGVTYWVQLFGK